MHIYTVARLPAMHVYRVSHGVHQCLWPACRYQDALVAVGGDDSVADDRLHVEFSVLDIEAGVILDALRCGTPQKRLFFSILFISLVFGQIGQDEDVLVWLGIRDIHRHLDGRPRPGDILQVFREPDQLFC